MENFENSKVNIILREPDERDYVQLYLIIVCRFSMPVLMGLL